MDGSVPTVLITGATAGIGRAAAQTMAARGVGLVIPVRDQQRGHEAADACQRAGAAFVNVVDCDLSLMASVRAAAAEVRRAHERIDVMVNDASVFLGTRQLTAEGHERMLATNYLGPFLLTNLLLESLLAAAPSRIVNVTAPSTVAPVPDDLESGRRFSAATAFGQTKAEELMFTYALARRLRDTGVTVNAFHPGVTKTGLMRSAPLPMRMFSAILSLGARTPARAAEGLAELALSPRFAGMTGHLIHDGEPIKAPFVEDVAAQERLWVATERALGL